ncbi:MAG: TetR/AcrR family transcriptional regulator [Pseudomonadota bacterium]
MRFRPMAETQLSTRDRLTMAAARLFQEAGYSGTSVADVLALAQAPKGSLYHHFPNGKADLASAAAAMASQVMLDITAAAYGPADDFAHGTQRLAEKFARLFERHPHWRACPVQTLLLDGPLATETAPLLQAWIDTTAAQATRLGHPKPDLAATRVWITLIGCWTLARARDDAQPLRDLPDLLLEGDNSGRSS